VSGAEPGVGYLIGIPDITILTSLKNPSNSPLSIFPHMKKKKLSCMIRFWRRQIWVTYSRGCFPKGFLFTVFFFQALRDLIIQNKDPFLKLNYLRLSGKAFPQIHNHISLQT
jgi:hypothetical protein